MAQLCPACGLCCNGVLFADVEVGPGDDAKTLVAAGLALKKKGRNTAFSQPCSCFDGALCRIYQARPGRCRAFECGLLKRVAAKRTSPAAALKMIARTRGQAERIREQMRQLGNHEEHLPLSQRFARIMAKPIDLGGAEELVEVRAELMLGVDALMKVLQREFRE